MKLLQRRKQPTTQDKSPTYSHYAGSGVCDVCNAPVRSGEAFQVPTSTFWASKKYKTWVATNPLTKMQLAMTGVSVDEFIAFQRARDKTKYSAVCPSCVHLFQ